MTRITKRQVGRPSVITTNVIEMLERALRIGLSIKKACKLAGISRSVYYENINNDPEFERRMWAAQQYLIMKAKVVVCQAIYNGNVSVSKWWLERKCPEEFSRR